MRFGDDVQHQGQLGDRPIINYPLADRLLERLEADSRARGATKSSLVRECLEQSLNVRPGGDKPSCYDLAGDLAGSMKGLPRDLATDPKYLEGFGKLIPVLMPGS